jgi:hypothetical protein
MKRITIFIRVLAGTAFLAVSVLWLKELTERRARRAADVLMGQLLMRVGWDHDILIPVFWRDLKGVRYWPGWYISYSTYFAFGEPLSIYVDVFGRIRTANSQAFIELIAMSEKERCKKQAEMVREDIAICEKADREREQRMAEQHAAPPRSVPRTGPSEGAR